MSKNIKFDGRKGADLLAALKGDEPLDLPVNVPDKALDISGAVVDILETLPDVNHKQRRIAYLLSRSLLPPEVAAKMQCTVAYVRLLMVDPRITELVKIFRGGKIYDFAEDLSARDVLKRASVRAAEVLAEKMNFAVDEATQLRAAIEVLKATGDIGGDNRLVTEIKIERDVVSVFQRAIEEDKEDDIEEAEYTEESVASESDSEEHEQPDETQLEQVYERYTRSLSPVDTEGDV